MKPHLRCLPALIVILVAAQLQAQDPAESDPVAIRGKVYTPYTVEELRARGLQVPDVPMGENAAWSYVHAMNAMVKVPEDLAETVAGTLNDGWPEGSEGERLAQWLEQNREALDLARKAAEMEQYYMPLFKGDQDALLLALLPPLAEFRQLARGMIVEARYLADQGKTDEAVEILLDAHRMGNHVARGQTLIEGLVGVATNELASMNLMALADAYEVDGELLRSAVAQMDAMTASLPSFEHMVMQEQRWSASFIDDCIGGVSGAEMLGVPPLLSIGNSATAGWKDLIVRLKRLYLPDRTMKKHLRDNYEKVVQAARRNDASTSAPLGEDELLASIPAWDFAATMLMPSLARVHESTLRSRSNFIRTKLAVAVAAWKADHGEPPPMLASMVPEYLPHVPPDPMTGYEFEYRPAQDSKSGHEGLDFVDSKRMKELRKKRRTPAILSPRASKWRRYVREFAERHGLSEAQRVSADAILRDIEARASAFERTHGAKIKDLIEAGRTEAARKKSDPLNKLHEELERRLETIPTARQRAAAREPSP